MQTLLASNNAGKVREVGELLKDSHVEIKTLKDLGLDNPVENGRTFVENSLIKARYGLEKTGLPTLADDSGFCIDCLNDFPGLFSARFAESCGALRNDLLNDGSNHLYTSDSPCFKILNDMIKRSNGDNRAHFTTCLAFVYRRSNKVEEKTFEGVCEGKFVYPPQGDNGFGYDPVFMLNGHNKTFAEISGEEKNRVSHRATALKKFKEFFMSFGS